MNQENYGEVFEVLWPRGRKMVGVSPLAKRLPTLENKTIGFLWDYLFRGDEIFPILEQELSKRFPGIKFVDYNEFGSTHGKEEREVLLGLPDQFKRLGVDAVISGMAC